MVTNVSTFVPVAASAFATDSVDGQRMRPSRVTRFDLLNVVGSSPDRLASPDGESPARSASRSSAVHICAWVSMGAPSGEASQPGKGILLGGGQYSPPFKGFQHHSARRLEPSAGRRYGPPPERIPPRGDDL